MAIGSTEVNTANRITADSGNKAEPVGYLITQRQEPLQNTKRPLDKFPTAGILADVDS